MDQIQRTNERNTNSREELEQGFALVRESTKRSLEAVNNEFLLFKSNLEVDFQRVCDTAMKDGHRITDLELQQKSFYKNQKSFEDQVEARRLELDKIRLRFEKIEPYVVLKSELEATFGEVQKAIKKLADENIAQQFELNVLNNFVDKYAPIRV